MCSFVKKLLLRDLHTAHARWTLYKLTAREEGGGVFNQIGDSPIGFRWNSGFRKGVSGVPRDENV